MVSLPEKRAAERIRLNALAPSEVDPHPDVQGVLLSDEIAFYVRECSLLQPFNPDNLKPAGYELTVGDEYFLSGEFHTFGNNATKITIPPFEVAVIKTGETLCLPRYLIARWNIRVKHAYEGLLWVGGPQVDPGYKGHLFCPIYNLSDKPVSLEFGEALALMDFVKTTPFDRKKKPSEPDLLKKYPEPPKRVIVQDYGIDELRSALFTRAGEKLGEFEETIRNLETRFITFTQISFAIFSLVVASIVATRVDTNQLALSLSLVASFGVVFLSIYSFLVVVFSHVERRLGRLMTDRYGTVFGEGARSAQRFLRRRWLIGVGLALSFALAGAAFVYRSIEPVFDDIRQKNLVTRSEFESMQADLLKRIQVLGAGTQNK